MSACAGVGVGGKFRKVPGGFRRMLVWVPGGKFRKVRESPVCGGVSSGGRFRKVERIPRFRKV